MQLAEAVYDDEPAATYTIRTNDTAEKLRTMTRKPGPPKYRVPKLRRTFSTPQSVSALFHTTFQTLLAALK
jgi:hypothetical protein